MSTPDIAARIAQFENMAQADPENEMAHYSLGGAYVQAGRFADAVTCYMRCTELAPGMSKAFQLAGDAAIKAGMKDDAAAILQRGYIVAVERGDRMPQAAIAELLKSLGRDVPQVAAKASASSAKDRSLLGGPSKGSVPTGGTKLEHPPFRGPLGEWIAANISSEKWHAWIGQGTKVINELRLDLSKEQDSEVYEQHMREYLGIELNCASLTDRSRELLHRLAAFRQPVPVEAAEWDGRKGVAGR